MSGRRLMIGLFALIALYVAAFLWFQLFAFYKRQQGLSALTIAGESVPIAGYDGIDASSSPLKLRGCFRIDPGAVAAQQAALQATPLVAPFWFRCFDAGRLTADLATGAARAYGIARDQPPGLDLMLAIYPDGRGYIWRQLNGRHID